MAKKRKMVEETGELTVQKQCELLGLNRSSYYYKLHPKVVENELKKAMLEMP